MPITTCRGDRRSQQTAVLGIVEFYSATEVECIKSKHRLPSDTSTGLNDHLLTTDSRLETRAFLYAILGHKQHDKSSCKEFGVAKLCRGCGVWCDREGPAGAMPFPPPLPGTGGSVGCTYVGCRREAGMELQYAPAAFLVW